MRNINVRKLILELKKMPRNLEVGVSMHDNSENEVAAWVYSVNEIIEETVPGGNEADGGKRCVVLSC